MASQPPPPQDLLAFTRSQRVSDPVDDPPEGVHLPISRRFVRFCAIAVVTLCILLVAAFVAGRFWMRHAMIGALPQLDGSLSVPGLHAPASIERDPHGVPTIRATSMDDLIFAQGYITASDRLFQMDSIRRHAAGELAEILGSSLLPHDRMQRTLQIRAAADRAVAQLPPDQLHWLEVYARGVNAADDAVHDHLPIEFRILNYRPKPWLPRDSLLVSLAMFEDLTNGFPEKLSREALTARLATDSPPDLRAQLLSDLFPVGSWRDHPPSQPVPDLTAPVDDVPPIPLDDSQVKLRHPAPTPRSTVEDLAALTQSLAPSLCSDCRAGSNNWVVSGAHTASGQPLLSNDMHLTLSVPGIWYAANLEAPLPGSAEPFHVVGVTLPGTPFVIVGHNQHVAWGFTNLGADVQDLYLEHTRGSGVSQEFQTADGNWRPMLHKRELIHVRGGADQTLDVLATEHGTAPTPVISPMIPTETRPVSLRWVIYDPGTLTSPFFSIDSATGAPALARAFEAFGGPAQNLVYADDHGHIGYHSTGHIPLRGSVLSPSPLSPVPTDATADAPSHEWAGYLPYDQLPQTVDPPGGILATANARITPDGYPFPITDNWSDPYRNQRIWKLLSGRQHLSAADMLAIQGDVYSDPDRVIAQRLAYALDRTLDRATDHANLRSDGKRLHQAADLLRSWNGKVSSDSPAAAIVDATRAALWPMILTPRLDASATASKSSTPRPKPWHLYLWGERSFAEEQIIVHAPARWLPPGYATWDDLLAAAVDEGLTNSHAPSNLSTWRFGKAHPLVVQHPLFAQSALLSRLAGLPTGVTSQAQSGNGTTIKQVGRSFGPSERFTADLANLDGSTLNLVLGESGNPASPYFLDQFPAWLHVSTFPLPFTDAATRSAARHSLTLNPR